MTPNFSRDGAHICVLVDVGMPCGKLFACFVCMGGCLGGGGGGY